MTHFHHHAIVLLISVMPSHDSSHSNSGHSDAQGDFTRRAVEKTLRSYDSQAAVYVRQWGRREARRPRLLQACMNLLPKGGLVLDLGCGPGQDMRALHRRRYRVVGLDLSKLLLRYARRRHRRVPLVRADMRSLPVHLQVFDGIWAAASLIHLPKPATRNLLRELKDLVRPGGVLAATFVHGRSSGFLKTGWIPGRYIARWHKEELRAAVHRAGWKVVSVETVVNRERKGRWLNLFARRPIEASRFVTHDTRQTSERSRS